MTLPWFKFYGTEYLSDPKMLQLNGYEKSCWVTLLCLAGQTEDGAVKFLSEEQLLVLSGVPSTNTGILKKFESLKLLRYSNGIVTLLNWKKRQYSESLERVRRFREKRKSNGKDTERVDKIRVDKNKPVQPTVAKQSVKSETQLLLELFYETNPGLNFGNTTQRGAADWLLTQFGYDQACQIIKYAISIQGERFAPRITTPYQLKEKYAELKIYRDKAV